MKQNTAYGRALVSIRIPLSVFIAATFLAGCLSKQSPGELSNAGTILSFTSPSTVSVLEGMSTSVYTAAATAHDGEQLSYQLDGGADESQFQLDSATGQLSFVASPDFEVPADSDGDNGYAVEIRAEDGAGRSGSLTLNIDVTNVNEAPVFTSNNSTSVDENTDTDYTATGIDPENDQLSYSIVGGDDGALFQVDPMQGFLDFIANPDFDNPQDGNADNAYLVEIRVEDGDGLGSSLLVVVNVTDISRLDLEPSFPTPNANLGGVIETMVAGGLSDLEDGVVEFDDVSFVDVDGQLAQRSATDSSRWSVSVPVNRPGDTLLLSTESPDQVADSMLLSVQNEALVLRPDLISIGADPDQLLIADSAGLGALVSVHLPTGASSVVTNIATGSGVEILLPEAAVLDVSSNRVLVADSVLDALLSIDLATGNRTLLSDSSNGLGPSLSNPVSLILDEPNNRVLLVDADLAALISIDLVSGDRTIVSDASVGGGAPFIVPTAIAYDPVSRIAYVADIIQETIFGVDLANGNRSILADSGTGASIDFPIAMALDAANGRLLFVDVNQEALVAVDLSNGAGSILSSATNGSGPAFGFPRSLAIDTRRDRALVVDLALNELLTVDLNTGNRQPYATARTGSGPSLPVPSAGALETGGERVLAAVDASGGDALIWIDVQSGLRSTLTDSATGSGPAIGQLTGVVLDEQAGRALVADTISNTILSVDLTTGDRVTTSGLTRGSGVVFQDVSALSFGVDINELLATDVSLAALLLVDLSTGDRSVISDAATGVGPALVSPTDVISNAQGTHAFVLDSASNSLLAIELSTGNRTIVSDALTGTGPAFVNPLRLAFDTENNRVLVADGVAPTNLCWVDLMSGDRTMVSTINSGGPIAIELTSILLDSENSRAFALDAEIAGLLVIELSSGQRAVVSR